jgi:hypothetical protein
MRAKRQRFLTFLLQPLALLAAVALGAAAAVWLVTPRIDALNTKVSTLTRGMEDLPAVDPSVVRTLDRLGDLCQSLVRENGDLRSEAARRDSELGAAVVDNQEKLLALAGEVRDIRVYLAAAAEQEPTPPVQATEPEAGPPESSKPPAVDLDTWLPLAADPDSGVRLSALVALEPSRDPRVLAAARSALRDGDAVVRAQGAKMVADRDDAESVPALIDLLLDPNSRVRVVAHRSLQSITGLRLEFDGTDSSEIRAGAVRAIRELLGQ